MDGALPGGAVKSRLSDIEPADCVGQAISCAALWVREPGLSLCASAGVFQVSASSVDKSVITACRGLRADQDLCCNDTQRRRTHHAHQSRGRMCKRLPRGALRWRKGRRQEMRKSGRRSCDGSGSKRDAKPKNESTTQKAKGHIGDGCDCGGWATDPVGSALSNRLHVTAAW